MIKNVCICQYGQSRSAAMARMLHEKGQAAVAIGILYQDGAINVLAPWVDRIFVMQPEFAAIVPEDQKHKVVIFDVGIDQWSNPYSDTLRAKLEEMYAKWDKK